MKMIFPKRTLVLSGRKRKDIPVFRNRAEDFELITCLDLKKIQDPISKNYRKYIEELAQKHHAK